MAGRHESCASAPEPTLTAEQLELKPADELPEPKLFGQARRKRTQDCAYPSGSRCEWLSDVILANAHVADERPEGRTPVRYKLHPRTSASTAPPPRRHHPLPGGSDPHRRHTQREGHADTLPDKATG